MYFFPLISYLSVVMENVSDLNFQGAKKGFEENGKITGGIMLGRNFC